MEESRIFGGVAFVFAFLCAFCLGSVVVAGIADIRKQQRLVGVSGVNESITAFLLRNGISICVPVSKTVLRFGLAERYCQGLIRVLGYRGMETTSVSVMSLIIGICLILTVGGLVFTGSFLIGIAGSFCLILGANAWVKHQDERRKEQLREQIPAALQSMKVCFCVGYSLPQTLNQVSIETKGVLSQIFSQAHSLLDSGGTVSQALQFIKNQSNDSELLFLVTALEIQHKTGSSMQQVLEAARDSVANELELKRALKTQTAQAKLSAQIVTIMPFALIGFFSIISPGFLDAFFESPLGLLMFATALTMQLSGVLLVRKMLRVEVV